MTAEEVKPTVKPTVAVKKAMAPPRRGPRRISKTSVVEGISPSDITHHGRWTMMTDDDSLRKYVKPWATKHGWFCKL